VIAAGQIRADPQACMAVAHVDEQPPAITPASLPMGTSNSYEPTDGGARRFRFELPEQEAPPGFEILIARAGQASDRAAAL
jgi:hypothetical protein